MRSRNMYAFALLAMGLVAGLLLSSSRPQTAAAQVPDQGAQIQQLIDETKALNAKMDRVIGILEGGKMQVKMVAENPK